MGSRIRRHARRGARTALAVTLAVLLAAPAVARAQATTEDRGTSGLQWVVRGGFALTFVALAFILVQAARSPSQGTSRLAAGTAAVDRGLARARSVTGPERAGDDTRSPRSARPATARGLRLARD
jgi:hypothetical protein